MFNNPIPWIDIPSYLVHVNHGAHPDIAGTMKRFEGHTHPQQPKNVYLLTWGLSPIHSTRRRGAQGLMWGARGAFLLAAAMVVEGVMPVEFCAKATEKCNKNIKIGCL